MCCCCYSCMHTHSPIKCCIIVNTSSLPRLFILSWPFLEHFIHQNNRTRAEQQQQKEKEEEEQGYRYRQGHRRRQGHRQGQHSDYHHILKQLAPFLLLMIPFWGIYSQMSTGFQNQGCQMNLSLTNRKSPPDARVSIPISGTV